MTAPRQRFLSEFCRELERRQGKNLVSIVLYGSEARGEARPDSDVDLLVVCEKLPRSLFRRTDLLLDAERALAPQREAARGSGEDPYFSVIFKTREEAERPSLLYLDLVEDAKLLYDRDRFFSSVLEHLKRRLETRGARRIRDGSVWYWDLKPDYRPGEIFELL